MGKPQKASLAMGLGFKKWPYTPSRIWKASEEDQWFLAIGGGGPRSIETCQSLLWPKAMFELGMNVLLPCIRSVGLVRCFWWEAPEVHNRHGNVIGFPCPCFAAFCSYICPFKKSALSSLISFPWLPVPQSVWDVPIVIPFLFLSQLMGKTNPKELIAGLVSLLTGTPIACLLFGLYESSWGLIWTDWVRNWLWGGCSRMAHNMWVTQESP